MNPSKELGKEIEKARAVQRKAEKKVSKLEGQLSSFKRQLAAERQHSAILATRAESLEALVEKLRAENAPESPQSNEQGEGG